MTTILPRSSAFPTYDYSIRVPLASILSLKFISATITNQATVWVADATIRDYIATVTITDVQSAIIWHRVGSRAGIETVTADASCKFSGSTKTWCITTQITTSTFRNSSSYTETEVFERTSIYHNVATLKPSWIVDGAFFPVLSTPTEDPSTSRIPTSTSKPNGKI